MRSAIRHLAAALEPSPALWPALRSLGPALTLVGAELPVPAGVAEQWRADLRHTRARNVLLLSELEHVLRALADAGTDAVVFKGAALVETLYPDLGARPMDDVDVLVRPSERHAAADVLERLGYVKRPPEPGRLGTVDDRVHAEWTYVRNVGRATVEVDLHWHLIADARLRALFPGADMFDPWVGVRRHAIGCASALRLDPIEETLALAVGQIMGHPWTHPLGYLDLTLAGNDLDETGWAELRHRARGRGLESTLHLALRFAGALFGLSPRDRRHAWRPVNPAAELLVGRDWLGLAPHRRDMAARDLLLLLLAGPAGTVRLARGFLARSSGRGRAGAVFALARSAARTAVG